MPVDLQSPRSTRLYWRGITCLALMTGAFACLLAAGLFRANSLTLDRICERQHLIVSVGAKLIYNPGQLKSYLDDGTITRAQYEQAVRNMRHNLETWRSADCRQ